MHPMLLVAAQHNNRRNDAASPRSRDDKAFRKSALQSLPQGLRIQEHIADQARLYPERTALIEGPFRLTYGELNAKANRLARYLVSLGLPPETPVGICMSGGRERMVAILAVLKAGGACVLLDPLMGAGWLADFISQARVERVIVEDHESLALFEQAPRLAVLDFRAVMAAAGEESGDDFELAWETDSLAAILPVSQIMGPRGIEMTHRALHRWPNAACDLGFSGETIALSMTAASQELGLFESLSILAAGGRLVFYGAAWPEAAEIANLIRREEINAAFFTPAWFSWLTDEDPGLFAPLKQVLIMEQELSPAHLPAIHLQKVLWQLTEGEVLLLYGPAEAPAAMLTRLRDEHDVERIIQIKPETLSGVQIHLLDTRRRPCPEGVIGEIHLGGEGLARLYRHDEVLTRQAFISDPGAPGDRLFRTGDFARRLPGGGFERLGRTDGRIFLRGRRIELTAIEQVLHRQKGVADALCDYRRCRAYGETLIAWIVETSPGAANEDRIRASLRHVLPAFAVPDFFHKLEALPLLPDGCPDRQSVARLPMFPAVPKRHRSSVSRTGALFSVLRRLGRKSTSQSNAVF